MTNNSSYTPFLIGQGQSKTGLFTYLDSWVKPEDAFDTLENAFVYRGSLYQRNGMKAWESQAGDGGLVYMDGTQIGQNTSGGILTTYNAGSAGYVVIPKLPIVSAQAGSFIVRVITSAGLETFTDNGLGVLTGDLGDTGTIDYATGAWSITLAGGRNIPNGNVIYGNYAYVPTQITTGVNDYNPIMGIKEFNDRTTGIPTTIVFDTRRASYYDRTQVSFKPLNQIQTYIFENAAGGATSTGATPKQLLFGNLTRLSVVITDQTNTTTDDGAGGIIATGAGLNDITGGTINYTTGTVQVLWGGGSGAPAGTVVQVTASLSGDYFTGDNTNFFNTTSWRYNTPVGSRLFATNNVDPVTTWDGTYLSRPLFNTVRDDVLNYNYNNNTIQTCIDVKVYKRRLLFLRPTLVNATRPEPQTIRYSIATFPRTSYSSRYSPWNFAADVKGNGGIVNATADDWIQGSAYIRDTLCLFFQRSTRLVRFTGSVDDPYRIDRLNVSRQTDAPYGIAAYDLTATSMGALGLIQTDGVYVDRYDTSIIDYIENINQEFFEQCYAYNDYPNNQTWMLYVDAANTAGTSNAALIYDSLEGTWATYSFDEDKPDMSVVGPGLWVQDETWASFGETWASTDSTWRSNFTQNRAPVLMGGDQRGNIFLMNIGSKDITPDETEYEIRTNIITKQLNPYIQDGLKASFGYVDIFYQVNPSVTLSINFYQNNNLFDPIVSQSITLNGDSNAYYAWKRVYIQTTAQFLRIGITNETPNDSGEYDNDSSFKILGMILYAAPAGRITPGQFI